MLARRAVVPHGLAGTNDTEDVGSLARGHPLSTAEETGAGVEGDAGTVESGLGD